MWAPNMVPYLLWRVMRAVGLYRVYKAYIRGPLLRAHTKGPCNHLKRQEASERERERHNVYCHEKYDQ